MDKNIKIYNVTLDSDVFAISLVDEPAIEENFIYLSKEKPQHICLEKDEKHLVVGPVLIPNKPIYRNNGKEEFYIQFSEQTIEKLAYDYLKNGFQSSITEQHEIEANGITVVESWLKTSENDKSNDYGMNLPVGTWMCAMKVENEETWNKIKAGEMHGFSVEAFVNLDEMKLMSNKKNIEMTEKVDLEQIEVSDNFWDRLKQIIADALGKPEETTPEEVVEEIAEEVKDAPTEEEEVVVEEEMKDEAPEEVEENLEEVSNEEIVEEVIEKVDAQPEDELTKIKELEDIIKALKDELASRDAKIDEMSKDIEKLSKQPSTKPVNVEASKQGEHPSFLDFASGRIKF